MNEEQWSKYYARLGIKPRSSAADVVRNGEFESAITEADKEKVLLSSEAAETKRVESATDHKSIYKEIRDTQVIELKEGEGNRRGQAQELRGQTKKQEVEESAKSEAEAVEGATGYEAGAEGELTESAGDEATPDSALFLGSKAAEELEPERATLAAATILPLSLLGNKKAWVWIVVLVCLAIAAYFLLEWYSRRGEVTSLPREAVKTSSGDPVRDFLDDY